MTNLTPTNTVNRLSVLKPFLSYLIAERIDEVAQLQVQLLHKHHHPILEIFQGMGEEEIIIFNKQAISDFFTKIIQNEPVEQIDQFILTLLANYFSKVKETAILETISVINHIRKRIFCHFLPDYCNGDAYAMHHLLQELDSFLLESQLTSSGTYIEILKTKIKQRSHFIQKVNNATPAFIYVYDLELNRIIYINKNVNEILGYGHDELMQMQCKQLLQLEHPEDTESIFRKRKLLKLFDITGFAQYQCRFLDKNKSWRWLMTREVSFKKDKDGHTIQILGSALDITAQKDIEATLVQKTVMLENANASLQEFAHIASHDLKEPLRKILLSGDYLKSFENDFPADKKKYIDRIIANSSHLHAMLQELLSLSLVNSNDTFEKCNLTVLWNQAVQTFEQIIEKTNAQVHSVVLPEAVVVAAQIRQLFENLLSNALKFRSETVSPIIRLEYEYITAGEMSYYGVAKADRYLKIMLSDNGIGFDEKYASKIFTIFQRLYPRDTYEGLGTGLTICKKIVEHHGGHMYATGLSQGGAIFTILLPA